MTATATKSDGEKIALLCDMKNPVTIRSNPVTKNHMFVKIERPPSLYGFRGHSKEKPSTLELIKILVLDNFIRSIINEDEAQKTIIIFVQSYDELNTINQYLVVMLRNKLRGKTKPWIVNHSAVGMHTKVKAQNDMDSGIIKLYISTSVMLCGIDLPRVDIILICRPFSHVSSILQAAGG